MRCAAPLAQVIPDPFTRRHVKPGKVVRAHAHNPGLFIFRHQPHHQTDCAINHHRQFNLAHRNTRFSNAANYVGQFSAGVSHGKGIYAWKNGQTYNGEWERNLPHGQGKLRFANGDVYEGNLVNGVPNGQGRKNFASGEIYAGQFINGLPDGRGTFTWKSGDRWEGIYENDQHTEKPVGSK